MKHITEKQIAAIKNLSKAAKKEIREIEQMSSFEASEVISELIKSLKNRSRRAGQKPAGNFGSDALAGLAVKILAQRCKVEDILSSQEKFKKRASELYRVFNSARQACLA